jgi:hypothetical protein
MKHRRSSLESVSSTDQGGGKRRGVNPGAYHQNEGRRAGFTGHRAMAASTRPGTTPIEPRTRTGTNGRSLDAWKEPNQAPEGLLVAAAIVDTGLEGATCVLRFLRAPLIRNANAELRGGGRAR